MDKAYLFYEAGQAVAAAHLRLKIRRVSANPALAATEITVPRDQPRTHMILWLSGLASEKKNAGRSNPLRRTRNRLRIRALIEAAANSMTGSKTRRMKDARNLLTQAQDHAHAIISSLYDAVEQVAALLRKKEVLEGPPIEAVVRKVKAARSAAGKTTADEHRPKHPPAKRPPGRPPARPKKSRPKKS